MSEREQVQDPLKSLDRVFESDPRHQGSVDVLKQQHAELNQIQLNAGAPLHVRQLFETAKNVSLYSWFAYRFHQVAELVAYTALERALKERSAQEKGLEVDVLQETLTPLLRRARQSGWLKSERFSATQGIAHQQLWQEQIVAIIRTNQFNDGPIEIPKISESDIQARAAELDYVDRVIEGIRHLRNHLAHGGPLLDATSAATLRIVAEIINQLFDNRADQI